VKGFSAAAILRAAICPVRDEEFCDLIPKRSGGHMEGSVASVKIVSDIGEKEVWRASAPSANLSPRGGKRGRGHQAAGQFVDVAIHDMSNEIKKDRLHIWHLFLVRLTTVMWFSDNTTFWRRL
jgi:hypothetical protein